MKKNLSKNLTFLLSPSGIREQAEKIFERTKQGKTHFALHPEKMEDLADFVIKEIKTNYPELKIPYHSRWGHFRVGGKDREQQLMASTQEISPRETARLKFDLVIPSVLLDAGAGAAWSYVPKGENKKYTRSEGLALASFDMFTSGCFSSDASQPLRTDAAKLLAFQANDVSHGFQVSPANPLEGLEGRAQLMVNLGQAIKLEPEIFAGGRLGSLVDYLLDTFGERIEAHDILLTILLSLGKIWPGRLKCEHTNLGDTWFYPPLGSGIAGFVPFHKLSQWLTYSLLEPLESLGVTILNLHHLTGLAEYRNGGLLLDFGLITLQDEGQKSLAHSPDSELIIEWRALTIHILDQLASLIQKKLNFSVADFPLAKVLEGGTWWAGRRLAQQKRADASPPLKILSDGTVF